MVIQQVAAIAIRVFSLWLLVQVILSIPSLAMLFGSAEHYLQEDMSLGIYLLLISSFVIIGLLAVYLLRKTAISVLERSQSDSGTTLSHDSQKLLFQLAGLYFIVDALALLPRSLSFIPHTAEVSLADLTWPIGLGFQVAIGVWLISHATFWLGLFRKLRGRT